MNLSPDSNQLLWLLGEHFLNCIIELTVFVFLYGLFVLLFSASVVLIARRGTRGIPQKLVFGATVLIFLLATLNVVNSIAGFVIFVCQSLIDNQDVPFEDRPALISRVQVPFATISVWARFLPLVFGDGIVIWRAWILLPERRWILTLPFLLWIGTLAGTTLAYAGRITTSPGYVSFMEGGSVDAIIQAGLALSVFTNASATLLIGWKLWSHRRRILTSDELGLTHHSTPTQKTLIILIESGVIYFTIQLTYLILLVCGPTKMGTSPFFVAYMLKSIYPMMAAMYPTIVFVLMHLQLSIPDILRFDTVSTRLVITRTADSERQSDAIPRRVSSQIYIPPAF